MKLSIVSMFVVVLFMSLTPASAELPKEQIAGQMLDLADQMTAAKVQGQSAVYASLENQYRELSDALGGDDPANLLSGTAEQQSAPLKAAPATPPPTPGGPGACTATTSNFSDSPGTPITTGVPISATLPVATADTYVWDVDLTTEIPHTFAADLDITLTSPAPTTITITTDNGAGNDDIFVGTLWDDFALLPVTDFPHVNLVTSTPLQPEGAFGAFIGEDPNGTWTLDIADDAGGDDGTLVSWSLDVTTLDAAPIFVGPTNFAAAPGLAITNGAPVSAPITVAGLETFICDVNLTTNITHTFASDLDITLTSPNLTVVVITTDNGSGNDDIFAGSVWDDDAPTGVTDFIHVNLVTSTPLQPEGAFGAFIGQDPNGIWTLDITDDASGDDGTLVSWSLDITTCSCQVPVELMSFEIE